ncbi:MAG TPA: secretin and TonB N-terminal domain-containing protein [Syntrophales bacterium]|nr:secretin and TonB N-terminal domain-containing protein [Syntrophales bacterium]
MKKNITWIIFLTAFVMFIGSGEYARSAPPEAATSPQVSAPKEQAADFGNLENITFEKMKGKERITIIASKLSGVDIEPSGGNSVLVKLQKTFVPEELKRALGEGKLANVINVVPAQKTSDGQQWAQITIAFRERVPYNVSQEGKSVFIDFNVSSLESKLQETEQKAPEASKEPAKKEVKTAERQIEKDKEATAFRRISLDFQDASIKAVLRLLAEEGGVTIVSGDDVKGNVTLSMRKVPWDSALESILDVQGLVKKQKDNVITVMTVERLKKDQADRRMAEEDRLKAEAIAKKQEQERAEERGRLRQIAIEAKIVEANDTFIRNLGVQWGGVSYNKIGNYSYALTAGTNTTTVNSNQWTYPSDIPFTNLTTGLPLQAAAVNFPTAVLSPISPTFGLVVGGGAAVLEAQIAALESNNLIKVVSSPKVTTMDNVKATIKQGQEIPYITIDKDGNRSITFKEAVLKLECKPKITPEGTISMEIKANNDAADYTQAALLGGNPPINKNEVESKVVVHDGDTIVLGGIIITEDQSGVSGVPWFQKIPILGWLFKTENLTKNRKQLMVFLTPKIVKGEATEVKPEKLKEG